MSVADLLKETALFSGLSDDELGAVVNLCVERSFPAGSIVIRQGDVGDEMFIIQEGQIEIVVVGSRPELRVVVLGKGQILGEMSLLDMGFRSATARTAMAATLQVIKQADFTALCEQDYRIGYAVMRNLAADLSFKLRHRNLATM